MRLATILAIIISVITLNSCVKQVTLNYRHAQPLLVVEGLLLTDSTPCKITLSYSGLFNSEGGQAQNFINDATVYLKSSLGDSIALPFTDSGMYISPGSVKAQVGLSYWLSIKLSNGKRYASIPENIQATPQTLSIDSIGEVPSTVLTNLYASNVTIRTQDPAGVKNYYRWMSLDYLPRYATGVSCGPTSPPCFQDCNQLYVDNNIYITSDDHIDGQPIRYQPVLQAPYYYYGPHYVLIKQLSLTQNAFEFWQLYQQQTTITGGIFDPIPSPIQGNIYNVNDSTELALGYFEASDVATLYVVLAPIFINAYYTLAYYQQYEGTGACYLIYPNAINGEPAGWGSAQQYIYNVY